MSTLKNSNFLVLKCYKLAFNFKTFLSNIGRIIMTSILFVSLIMLIYFGIYDNKNIDKIIKSIIKKKINDKSNNKNNLNERKSRTEKSKTKDQSKKNEKKKSDKSKRNSQHKSSSQSNKHLKNILKSAPPKNESSTKRSKTIRNSRNMNSSFRMIEELHNNRKEKDGKLDQNINILKINTYNIKNVIKGKNEKSQNERASIFKIVKDPLIAKSKIKTYSKNEQEFYNSIKNKFNLKTIKDKNEMISELKKINFNDEELNNLEYDLALIVDKRSYFQYYWSLLKKKQLILFTFVPSNDYNLLSIKILLFLISFSLYFTINAFFFSDDTMHKIHEDNGKFNIIYQIPQILYSSIISVIINMILKQLSLSEKNIIKLKQENDIKKIVNTAKKIKTCILIKTIIYFLLNCIFLIFFWYFISCFCAVYKNTQIILIKDTFFSFGLSMLYPFGLNLLAGFFRIPALRAKNRDKKFLYQFSTLVALI